MFRTIACRAVFVFVATLLGAGHRSLGQTGTDLPGAILVFPKVVSDENQETIIQISNATAAEIEAVCFYINGALDPDTKEPIWGLTDFRLRLTRSQPTVWLAGVGLPAVPPDSRPPELYPGPVPPVGIGFMGDLRCVVVNDSEIPISRNALTGEATVIDRSTTATRKYRAISIRGLPGNNGDNTLLFNEIEYSTCPRLLLLNHFFDAAPDPVLNTPIQSTITLVPCSADVERGIPGRATVLFEVFNEFEQRLSASLEVICFRTINLSAIDNKSDPTRSIFHYALQGTLVGQTRIRPVPDARTDLGHGILAVAEEFRDDFHIGSAVNVHFISGSLQPDVLIIPGSF